MGRLELGSGYVCVAGTLAQGWSGFHPAVGGGRRHMSTQAMVGRAAVTQHRVQRSLLHQISILNRLYYRKSQHHVSFVRSRSFKRKR